MNLNIKIDYKQLPIILLKSYKIILVVIALSLFMALVYCKFAPRKYTADCIIIPPKLSDAGSGLSPAVSMVMGLSQQRGGSVDATIALLQTREVSRLVNDYLVHDPKYKDTKMLMPYGVSYIPDPRSGFLDIAVTSPSGEYSKDVANYVIVALGKHISNIATSKALQKASFYTQQLEIAKNNRDVAESKLIAFKSKRGMTAGSQDVIVTGMITSLQAQYVAQQTTLDSLSSYLTPDNPDYKSAEAQLDAIKQRIVDLNNTVANNKKNTESQVFDDLFTPTFTAEYEILQNEFDLRSLIYSVLVKQYEANNLDLQSEQDPVSIDVIDPPVVPFSYSFPQVKKVMMFTFVISMLISIIIVLALNRKKFIHNDNV